MRHLALPGQDPAFNLAFEEALFTSLPEGHPGIFMLWQNSPSIIIGRHQCAYEEANNESLHALQIPLVRRITGGGAVYHDLGNLNFTFILTGQHQPTPHTLLEPICQALRSLGANAALAGRNDIEINGRKISGTAIGRRPGRMLLHGALLHNTDLEMLARILTPAKTKFQSKGIASVKSRVANITDYIDKNLDQLKQALLSIWPEPEPELDPAIHNLANDLYRRKYANPAWNFGASPPFNLEKRKRFSWGELVCRANIRKGLIESCGIYGDFFGDCGTEGITGALQGCQFDKASILAALKDLHMGGIFLNCDAAEIMAFFASLPDG